MKKLLSIFAALALFTVPALAAMTFENSKGILRNASWFVCIEKADAKEVFDDAKVHGLDASFKVFQAKEITSACRQYIGPASIIQSFESADFAEEGKTLHLIELNLNGKIVYGIFGQYTTPSS